MQADWLVATSTDASRYRVISFMNIPRGRARCKRLFLYKTKQNIKNKNAKHRVQFIEKVAQILFIDMVVDIFPLLIHISTVLYGTVQTTRQKY